VPLQAALLPIAGLELTISFFKENAEAINACQDKTLRQCLVRSLRVHIATQGLHAPNTSMRTHSGVGFHHGSLSQADRRIVEHLFVSRALFCLFATSTLAVGANLPAYLVIIKSTIQVC
jgi:superfamily II RNA helicase